MDEMNQRLIFLNFARKGSSTVVIDIYLVSRPGSNSVSDGSLTSCLREAKRPPHSHLITSSEEKPPSDNSGEAVLFELTEQLFTSILQ
jgi:hypothetical protein